MLVICSTFPSEKDAKKAGRSLARMRLAACASVFPCSSLYLWGGRMQNKKEWVLELKAKAANYKKIEGFLLKIHHYKIPAIYAIKTARAEKRFEKWVCGP